MKKTLLFFALAFVLGGTLFAQRPSDAFARIEKSIKFQHYTDAYTVADSVRTDALKRVAATGVTNELSRTLLTSTWYMEKAAIEYQEEVKDSSLARFRAILPYMTTADRSLCYLFLENVDSALVDTLALRSVPCTQLLPFCTPPSIERYINVTPTMYDMVMYLAQDRVSLERLIQLQQQLVAWYRSLPATKGNTTLLLYNELKYIGSLAERPNTPASRKYALYQDCLNRYRHVDDPQVALLYSHLADLYKRDSNYLTALDYCDSAIRRYPESEGGIECANLRDKILKKWIYLIEMEETYPTGRDLLCSVMTGNVDTLYYRIVDASKTPQKYLSENEMRRYYLGCKVLKSWSQPLDVEPDHREYEHYVYLPTLPSGHYALLASPSRDFAADGFYLKNFTVVPAAFVRTKDVREGYLVDYATGAPIPNQKVELQKSRNYSENYKTLATTMTDKQGFYRFDQKLTTGYGISYRVMTQYDGIKIMDRDYYSIRRQDSVVTACEFFLDRPVYRPGDTVQFLLVRSQVRHNRVGKTVQGDSFKIVLGDVNGQVVDSLLGVTDAYGSLHGRMAIPAQALPGAFSLNALLRQPNGEYETEFFESIKVEAYKQPKFTVTLKAADRRDAQGRSLQPQMGDSLAVDGLAASYSQVPIANARVSYRVERSFLRPWWRNFYYGSYGETTVIASDSVVTDAEGHFRIDFVASPDSSMELSDKPCFIYTVKVDVTDLNGETHSQTLPLRLGYENSFISITGGERSVWDTLEYQYCDLNGTPLQGDLQLTVERLQQPKRLWLNREIINGNARHTLAESEFCRRFPYLPYSYDETRMEKWPTEKVVFETQLHSQGLNSNAVSLPKLTPGAYRVRMRCGDISNEAVVVYTPSETQQVQTMDLLWFDQSHAQAQVGDTVLIRVGSRHHDVTAVYQLLCDDQELDRRQLQIDGNIVTLRIPVTETMLGGFDIHLHAVKEGYDVAEKLRVEVPFVHKQLEVTFTTFRDKLVPGEQETWTLNLKRKSATPAGRQSVSVGDSAALLLTMYDASLDSYGPLSYLWWPWDYQNSVDPQNVDFDIPYYLSHQENLLIYYKLYLHYQGKGFARTEMTALHHRNWRWHHGREARLYSTARGESGMVTAAAKSRRVPVADVGDSPNAAYSKSNSEQDEIPVVEEVMILSIAEEEAEPTLSVGGKGGTSNSSEKPYIRTNLSTLAFFEPTLRTQADGSVSYSFTAPDLLTQWNVKGLAWTQDLAVGQVERSLITQKQLMIQPNMPRFLREGDTATLMAKVMNLTDSDMVVMVDFAFDIPATAQLPQQCQSESREVHLPARGNAMVAFPVTIPVGGTVATYRYMVCGSHHSDGEQGPLPLLTNRQAVTTSVSMFMNGKGVKEYSLTLPTSATAQPVSFTVEYTANPVWMAIQSLPYMAECANPSNIYLFNSYYVNTLGKTIADQYPELKHCADNATEAESPLFRNADVRQTLLSETPWLNAGTSEVERLKAIANFYDGAALQRQVDEAIGKLQDAQRGDGSWSWMPEGRYGSTYVTQYLLKGLGNMARHQLRQPSRMENRALDYVDKEAYKDYLEWMKYLKKHPSSTCRPIMLDYLYTRSYYPDKAPNATHKKAYDYYYNNAKERYSDYTSLYDQALLALVFHRHGDTKLAREMVNRIKQKALYSDEMGMYWRDNRSGYFYYQRPVETQALLIETFREVLPADTLSVGQMQQWLLKQKQTTRWSSDVATLRAIQALMPTDKAAKQNFGRVGEADRIVVRGNAVSDTLATPVENSGYLRHTYRNDSLAAMSGDKTISATLLRPNKGISWGALFYQYTEQMDKVPASETGIRMTRQLYRVNTDGSLTEITPGGKAQLHVGDRLRIVLNLSCDRNLEYVEMKNFRAACLEPVTTASGWCWTQGLSYYVAVNNSHDALYVDRLDKGKYTIESTYYITNPGTFTLAPSVLQCLYAPEFRSTSSGLRLTVE